METRNLHPAQADDMSPLLSPNGVVTERLSRISKDEIFYEFSVDDPETYTQPWKAELSFYPSPALYEYACHEGNHGMIGILAGARELEREAMKTSAKPTR